MSFISPGLIWNPGEVAHTLVPAASKMAALSTSPVATRLVCESGLEGRLLGLRGYEEGQNEGKRE